MATKKKAQEPNKVRPPYLNEDGTLELSKIFKHQPKQTELLEIRTVNGEPYIRALAPQCLSVGGIRSGKTVGVLMYFIMNYTLAYEGCDILILRRTFKELESGCIADFKTFVPKELYSYDQTKHVATFVNGSRVVFGHCQNNKMRDIEQYLGQAYPAILVDEAGQFSPDAWMMLYSRNTVNASCKPDKNGNMPLPIIWGCSNPLGPYYEYYRTVFVQKEPWAKPENSRKDETNGTWWVQEAGNWHCIYNPELYACQRSTVMDNPELLKRDPGIIARLNSMPKAKRDKLLLGLDGAVEGQYYDCFDPFEHVIDLREDPEAIIWQHWQPIVGAQDWSMGGHHNAAYLFTKAMVRTIGTEYKLKTVCFRETVMQGGKTHKEWATIFKSMCKRIGGMDDRRSDWLDEEHKYIKPKTIFFSHEKFARQVTQHSPADEYSKELRELGLPSVTRANPDRVGGASLIYNMFKNGQLVILDTCRDIILALPSLMRDPDNMDDVLKVDSRGDDCYDAFRYGLYGMYAAKNRPEEDTINDYGRQLAKTDPVAAHFYLLKMANEAAKRTSVFLQKEQPVWMGKVNM